MAESFFINDFEVGTFLNPYLIAEIGVNHEGDINLAKRLIDQAASGGAHAAKFQSYKAEKLASRNSPAYWDTTQEPTESQYKLFQKYDSFGPDDYRELALHCKKRGIHFLSTPFDLDAVEFLTPLVPAFKIASADITNVPLIRKAAASGKPLIISTGASTQPEIEFAVEQSRLAGAHDICLLHCVLNYPTKIEDAQLGRIPLLMRSFPDCMIGYSDHVAPDESLAALELATMLGSTVIEKHFTHDKTLPGNDHYHAMDEGDLLAISRKLAAYRQMIGSGQYQVDQEASARKHARRSVVAACNIQAGERLTADNLTTKRPAHGISPVHWDELLGRIAIADIEEDQVISWDVLACVSDQP
jgi:sialic acid synthase SpsE